MEIKIGGIMINLTFKIENLFKNHIPKFTPLICISKTIYNTLSCTKFKNCLFTYNEMNFQFK